MRFPVHIDYAYRRGRNGHSDKQSRDSSSPKLENRDQKARSRDDNCSCEICGEISNSNSISSGLDPLSRPSYDSSKNPSLDMKSRGSGTSRFFDSSSSQYTLQSTESTGYEYISWNNPKSTRSSLIDIIRSPKDPGNSSSSYFFYTFHID